MRCLKRINGKTVEVYPGNLSAWLWQHDGVNAVVIDGNVYYCGTEELKAQYEAKWKEENKLHEKRRVSDFLALGRQLFAKETPIPPDQSPAWCESEMCLCSEIANCTGACLA